MSRGDTGHIFWNNKKGKCGGHLDVDMNATTKHMVSAPIENIFCTVSSLLHLPSSCRSFTLLSLRCLHFSGDKPPPGKYRIWVENNEIRTDSPTPFTARLTKDGKSEEVSD